MYPWTGFRPVARTRGGARQGEARYVPQAAQHAARSNDLILSPVGYRVEKQAARRIQLPDEDAAIELVPTTGGGRKPEAELDRLSNIIKTFNDQFGNIPWTDGDRVSPA